MGTFFEPKVNWSADICLFCNDRIFISLGKNLVDQKSLKLRNVIIEDIPDVSDSSKSIFSNDRKGPLFKRDQTSEKKTEIFIR